MDAQVTTQPAEGMPVRGEYKLPDLMNCAGGKWGDGVPRLPLPPMLMFEGISTITADGGEFGKGVVRAEHYVNADDWFFLCHFLDDPVMPGCLQLDALWQMTGFFAGWSGGRGKGRATSVGEVKFVGEILPTARLVTYRVDFKRVVVGRKKSFAVGNGVVTCDGKIVCTATDLTAFILA